MTKIIFRSVAMKWLAWMLGAAILPILFLLVLDAAGACRGPSGAVACLPFTLGLMFVARPIALVAIALFILWCVHKRTSVLQMGIGWPVAAFLWLFGALPFLAFGVSSWNTSFIVGLLTSSRLDLLMFALSFIAFLSYAESSAIHNDRSDLRLAWIVAIAIAAHFTLLHAYSILGAISLIPWLGALLHGVLRPVFAMLHYASLAASFGIPGRQLFWLQWLDFVIFSAALAYLIANQDKEGEAPSGTLLARPRPISGNGPTAPRATFGRREG